MGELLALGMRSLAIHTLWVVALGLGCGSKDPPANWIATVTSFTGVVTVTHGGKPHPVEKGEYLQVGDRLETGPRAEAVLSLSNKGEIRVKPNSVLLFRSGESTTKLSLSLEQGSVIGAGSKVEAAELLIAVGQRRIRLAGESRATVAVPESKEGTARVEVTLGEATIEGPAGSQTVVAGQELVVETRGEPRKPDAGPPPATPDASVEQPVSKTYYLQRLGRGRVLIKAPGQKRFTQIRRGRWVEVAPGTVIKLLGGAHARFGKEKGEKGTLLTGPGVVVVKEQGADQVDSPLEHVQGDIVLSQKGPPGTKGSSFNIDGVTVTPQVRYQRADVRIRRKGNRHLVVVNAGQAELKSKNRTVVLEAGEETTIGGGGISPPRIPPQAPFKIRQFGTIRIFTSDVRLPVTFRWKLDGADGALVRVSRHQSMARPLFSDIIKRQVLTIPEARRGTLYWSVSTLEGGKPGKAQQGRLILVRDTSYRVLKNYHPPRNTIHESFNNTTVFYQNQLPRFTFKWNPMEGAAKYNLKIFREQNLQKPLVDITTKKLDVGLAPGKIGEGAYIWYAVGRSASNEFIRALKGRKLTVRYDNATPDIQIVYPRNGLVVGEGTIEAKGVTIPGSKVYVNNVEASLDRGFRFSHPVKLTGGVNYIHFRVVARKGGASAYLRRVTRK